MASMTMKAAEVSESITLHITGLNVMRARWWIAAQIMRLAGAVAGCNIEIETR